jgi:hypothetical protein
MQVKLKCKLQDVQRIRIDAEITINLPLLKGQRNMN